MAKYEFLLAIKDEQDLALVKRKKEGDIVAVRPYPWNWGSSEINEYLVVIMTSPLSITKLRNLYETVGAGGKKNRFSIKLNKIKSKYVKFDITKAQDRTYIYQPFKKRSQLLGKLNGVLKEGDIDAGDNPEEEVVLDLWPDIYDAGLEVFTFGGVNYKERDAIVAEAREARLRALANVGGPTE